MKLKFNKEDNVLVVEYSKDKIDDVYESNNMLIHVNHDKEPVLIEIFNASHFLSQASRTLPTEIKRSLLSP